MKKTCVNCSQCVQISARDISHFYLGEGGEILSMCPPTAHCLRVIVLVWTCHKSTQSYSLKHLLFLPQNFMAMPNALPHYKEFYGVLVKGPTTFNCYLLVPRIHRVFHTTILLPVPNRTVLTFLLFLLILWSTCVFGILNNGCSTVFFSLFL